MKKTYKYKLYINKQKFKYLDKQLYIASNVYNHCIALHKIYYRIFKKHLNIYKLQKHLTKLKKLKKYQFWNQLNSYVLQDITNRIENSYQQFFNSLKKKINKYSPPSFQSYKKYKSMTLRPQNGGIKFLENNIMRLNKKMFKYSKHRDIEGTIKQVTIKRNNLGEYFIFVICDIINVSNSVKYTTGKIEAFDFGLKTFLTSSDNYKIDSPLFFHQMQNELKKKHKKFSKKQKGSNQRKKAKLELNRLYIKLTDKRKDYFFKLGKVLTERNDYIFIEDLNIASMMKIWGKKISDLSFSEFVSILEYQGMKNQCIIKKIDRFFPSSKACSNCGCVKETLSLKERIYHCDDCGFEIDRDYNAALNILQGGASSCSLDYVRPSMKAVIV